MRNFEEILEMVSDACTKVFYSGDKDAKQTVIECATQIYIAEMKEDA